MAAGDGLVSMRPTSISHSGTGAVINASGGVNFTAVTEVNLNGVFTSAYDNYMIVMDYTGTASNDGLDVRLRASGSDASGTDYVNQLLNVDGSSAAGIRQTGQTRARVARTNDTLALGLQLAVYGPALAEPTAIRSVSVSSYNSAYLADSAATHSLSTSYDGITIFPAAGSLTGTVHVFGYEE